MKNIPDFIKEQFTHIRFQTVGCTQPVSGAIFPVILMENEATRQVEAVNIVLNL